MLRRDAHKPAHAAAPVVSGSAGGGASHTVHASSSRKVAPRPAAAGTSSTPVNEATVETQLQLVVAERDELKILNNELWQGYESAREELRRTKVRRPLVVMTDLVRLSSPPRSRPRPTARASVVGRLLRRPAQSLAPTDHHVAGQPNRRIPSRSLHLHACRSALFPLAGQQRGHACRRGGHGLTSLLNLCAVAPARIAGAVRCPHA